MYGNSNRIQVTKQQTIIDTAWAWLKRDVMVKITILGDFTPLYIEGYYNLTVHIYTHFLHCVHHCNSSNLIHYIAEDTR